MADDLYKWMTESVPGTVFGETTAKIPRRKKFSSAPQDFKDPGGMVMPDDPVPQRTWKEDRMANESLGQGYPKNEVYWITVIEDPPLTIGVEDPKPPRFALNPKSFLAPSLEVAFLMAGREIPAEFDLQRCRVRVANG